MTLKATLQVAVIEYLQSRSVGAENPAKERLYAELGAHVERGGDHVRPSNKTEEVECFDGVARLQGDEGCATTPMNTPDIEAVREDALQPPSDLREKRFKLVLVCHASQRGENREGSSLRRFEKAAMPRRQTSRVTGARKATGEGHSHETIVQGTKQLFHVVRGIAQP